MLDEEQIRLIELLAVKERILAEIIAWLKAKEIWDNVRCDLGIRESVDGDVSKGVKCA